MSGAEDGDRELQVSTVSIDPEGVRVVVRDTEESTQLEVCATTASSPEPMAQVAAGW